MPRDRWIRWYYLATPVFAALDLVVGASIRAAGIANPLGRAAYYLFALACGLLLRARPRWAPLIGIGESSVNLFVLILSILGPLFLMPGRIAEGANPEFAFGLGRMVNVLLSGGVLIWSFQGNVARLGSRSRAGGPDRPVESPRAPLP